MNVFIVHVLHEWSLNAAFLGYSFLTVSGDRARDFNALIPLARPIWPFLPIWSIWPTRSIVSHVVYSVVLYI